MNRKAIGGFNGAEATSTDFCNLLCEHGFDLFAGVPCSIFKGLIHQFEMDSRIDYMPAVREDTAVGIAAGAIMSGRHAGLLMQNSGLGVCLNALTSLAIIYEIPLLMLISWRGYQGKDAPEHVVMGDAMLGILDRVGVGYEVLQPTGIDSALDRAVAQLASKPGPYALICRKEVLK